MTAELKDNTSDEVVTFLHNIGISLYAVPASDNKFNYTEEKTIKPVDTSNDEGPKENEPKRKKPKDFYGVEIIPGTARTLAMYRLTPSEKDRQALINKGYTSTQLDQILKSK